MLFYITLLINLAALGVVPNAGWMQDITPFDTKAECEDALIEKMPLLAANIAQWSGGAGTIDSWECMTEEEWIKRNVEMGHTIPKEFEPKEEETLPKIEN